MLRHPSSFSCGDTFRKEARKGCTRRLSRLRLRGNAWILRWESFARRRTPLPQDDNGERKANTGYRTGRLAGWMSGSSNLVIDVSFRGAPREESAQRSGAADS